MVALPPGFLAPGSGGILDSPMFSGADFLGANYAVARITVTAVPEASALAVGGLMMLLGVGWVANQRRRRAAVVAMDR